MTVIAAETVTIVIGGLLYLILLITLGILSIRKGHWVMFIIGIFIPLFWLIGALLPPTASARR
jgi:ABC-type multidrug transport system permease subunit